MPGLFSHLTPSRLPPRPDYSIRRARSASPLRSGGKGVLGVQPPAQNTPFPSGRGQGDGRGATAPPTDARYHSNIPNHPTPRTLSRTKLTIP